MRTRNNEEKDRKDALWLPIRENIKKQQNLKKENNRVDVWREVGKKKWKEKNNTIFLEW